MTFYSIAISPIEQFLHMILQFLYTLISNYGFSIILLSICVNLILLPVYMLAESLQSKELAIRNLMHSKLQEIKRVFRGQEQFMMTQTLYRIHNYHPIMGLRSMGSLLIQIPFFLAAYNLLKHFEPFAGLSFLFISDLQKPDALIPLGRFTINILPFIMTIVNIIAAQIYTRRKNPQALFSTWGIALVFLLILYSSPSALVLYWTCNNIFSLLKNLILEYRASHKATSDLDTSLLTKQKSTVQLLTSQFSQWLSDNKKIRNTILTLWGIATYLLASYALIPSNRLRGLVPNTLINFAGVLLAITALILLLKYRSVPHIKGRSTMLWVYGISTCLALILLVYYIYVPEYKVELTIVKIKLLSFMLFALPNVFFLPISIKILYRPFTKFSLSDNGVSGSSIDRLRYASARVSKNLNPTHLWAVIMSLISGLILIFFALPSQIFMSAPIEIGMSFSTIASHNAPYAITAFLALFTSYIIAPKRIKLFVAYILVGATSLLLIYALIVPFDLGRMDHFKLIFPQRIVPTLPIYFLEGVGIILFIKYLCTHFKTKPIHVLIINSVFALILIIPLLKFSIWGTHTISSFNTTPQTAYQDLQPSSETSKKTSNQPNPQPHNVDKMFSFSTSGENIIVFLLDMANGGHIQRMTEEEPDFARQFKDFVWYPNTLSISTFTTPSKPAMLAGWRFTPEHIKNIEGENLAQKVIASYDTMFSTFEKYNYDIAISGMLYYGADMAQCSTLEIRDIACLDYWDTSYTSYWLANTTQNSNESNQIAVSKQVMIVNMAGLLRAVPITFKQRIYDQGNWNLYLSLYKNQAGYNAALPEWAVLDSLDTLSSTTKSDRNTFKYIHTNLTHRPYALDKNCVLRNDVFPDEQAGNDFEGDAAYYTLRCSLISIERWIQWLRDNGVYDNTKIILVSDHGNDFTVDPMNNAHFAPKLMGQEHEYMFSRAHVLLMVKDFYTSTDQNKSLQIDERLMSNVDSATIMYYSIKNYQAPEHALPQDKIDPTKTNRSTREIPIYHTSFYNWVDLVKEKKGFKILEKYVVKDNIFIPSNWSYIK